MKSNIMCHCLNGSAMALAVLSDLSMPCLTILSEKSCALGCITIELCGALAAQCPTAHLRGKVISLGLEVLRNAWRLLGWQIARNLNIFHGSFGPPHCSLRFGDCLTLRL